MASALGQSLCPPCGGWVAGLSWEASESEEGGPGQGQELMNFASSLAGKPSRDQQCEGVLEKEGT